MPSAITVRHRRRAPWRRRVAVAAVLAAGVMVAGVKVRLWRDTQILVRWQRTTDETDTLRFLAEVSAVLPAPGRTVGAGAGSTMTLGIETGKTEPKIRQGEVRGGGRGRRGGGSPGGGPGEGGRSGSARARGDRPEPLSFWAKIQLSVAPAQ